MESEVRTKEIKISREISILHYMNSRALPFFFVALEKETFLLDLLTMS